MRHLTWTAIIGVTGTLLCGILLTVSGECASWANDFWNLPALQEEIEQNRRERAALDAQDVVVLRRIQAKTTIAESVHRGEMTFEDGVAAFRALHEAESSHLKHLRARYPGWDDDAIFTRLLTVYLTDGLANSDRGSALRAMDAKLPRE